MSIEGEKGHEVTPLTKMENKVEEVRFMIQLIKIGSKPKSRRVFLTLSKLILLKYFEIYNFKSIPRVLVICKD